MADQSLMEEKEKIMNQKRYKKTVKRNIKQLILIKKRMLKKAKSLNKDIRRNTDDSDTDAYSDCDVDLTKLESNPNDDDIFKGLVEDKFRHLEVYNRVMNNLKRKASIDNVHDSVKKTKYRRKKRTFTIEEHNDNILPSDDDHDTSECDCHIPLHLKYAETLFRNTEMLYPLIKRLYSNNILEDFINMMQVISTGVVKTRNIPLLALLDRTNLEKCTTTTKMKYFKETMELWQVVRRTCKYSGLLLFSGLKHGGQVSNNMCEKGKYNPQAASVNFAVPHWQTLANHEVEIPKYLHPGMIGKSFDLLDTDKEYVLEFDAKSVARGLKPDQVGDINLWGYEGPPNLKEVKNQLNREVHRLELLQNSEMLDDVTLNQLPQVLTNVSNRIKEVRYLKRGHKALKMKLLKMSESHPKTEKRFTNALGTVKGTIYQCDNWIDRALKFNLRLCQIMSAINGTESIFNTSNSADIDSLSNVRILNQPMYINNSINLDDHPEFVKQRSDLWLKMRKKSYVTGSSCYNALGLSTLAKQRQHFREFVLDMPKPPFDKETQQRIQHGIDNEINAIGTLCCRLMPALLPKCATYWEDGCNFLDGDVVKNLMEFSADGVIKLCSSVQNACKHLFCDDGNILVECKCPFPKEDGITVHYEVPLCYACQVLAGMKIKKCSRCWYASYSPESLTLFVIVFDEAVWQEVWKLLKGLLDMQHPKIPQKKVDGVIELKSILKEYLKSNSKFIAEVPSLTCSEVQFFDPYYDDIYLQVVPTLLKPVGSQAIVDKLHEVAIDGICITEECFELLRKKSNEILAFILTNSDRQKSSNKLAHIPIAYAMKGNSLPSATMRQLLEDVHDECHKKGIRILCDVCDGQWHTIVMRSCEGYPLTQLQFQKFIWSKTIQMSKEEMLDYLTSFCKIDGDTLEDLSIQGNNFLTNGTWTSGNLQVKCDFQQIISRHPRKRFTLITRGGNNAMIPLMRYIRTIPVQISPEIWKGTQKSKSGQHQSPQIEVTAADIFAKLPEDVHEDALHILQQAVDENEVQGTLDDVIYEASSSDEDSEEQSQSINVTSSVLIPRRTSDILSDILDALRNIKHKPLWVNMTVKELFTKYLQEADVVAKTFVVKELDAINKVYEAYFKQKLFKSQDNKDVKVNRIVGKFGNKSIFVRKSKKIYNPSSLKILSDKVLKSTAVPKHVIASTVAFMKHKLEYAQWKASFTVPDKIYIDHKLTYFELFSFPELSLRRNRIEPRCLDVTHMLTNLRTHVCKSGFKGIDKKAFMRASQKDPNYLPRPIIEDLIDQQNAEYAKKVFSVRVQKLMESNGDYGEAQFVKIVRQWYRACDDRGLMPNDRIDRLLTMHNYLMENVSFNTFPPPSTHVKGIPIITYEGLLQNISTRITLYTLAQHNTYNHRAISTLGVESFFSDLSRVEFTQTGCPKACQIPKLISAVCEVNAHKHNPHKGFVMDQRRGAPYPEREMDVHNILRNNDLSTCQSIFKPHAFDVFDRKGKRRNKYKPNIALPNETERGKLSIRHLYRRNEFKLTSLQRLSLPKDFDNVD